MKTKYTHICPFISFGHKNKLKMEGAACFTGLSLQALWIYSKKSWPLKDVMSI